MSSNIPMTPEGHAKIKAELQHLKTVERPWVISQIATAREHGDLRENAEYHAARDKQSFIEGRIAEIEDKLSRAEIIDPSRLGGTRVAFGATVVLCNDAGDEVRYRIVGPVEADTDTGAISVFSPLAKQLIGREAGDEVKVTTPGGSRVYEVLEVSFNKG